MIKRPAIFDAEEFIKSKDDRYKLGDMSKTELINYAMHSADELAYVGKRITELTKSLDATHMHHKMPVVGCPSCDEKLLRLAREITGEL